MSTPRLTSAELSKLERKLYDRPIVHFLSVTAILTILGAVILAAIFAMLMFGGKLGGEGATALSFIEPSVAIAGATVGLSVSFAGALVAILLARRALFQAEQSKDISELQANLAEQQNIISNRQTEIADRQAAIDETNLFHDFILGSGLFEAGVRDAKEVLPVIEAIYESSIELQLLATEKEIELRFPDYEHEEWDREERINELREQGYQLDPEDEGFVGPRAKLDEKLKNAMEPHRARITDSLQSLSEFLAHHGMGRQDLLSATDDEAIAESTTLLSKAAEDMNFELKVTEANIPTLTGAVASKPEAWLSALLDELGMHLRHREPAALDEGVWDYLPGRQEKLRQLLMGNALRMAPAVFFREAKTLPRAEIYLDHHRGLQFNFAAAMITSALRVTSTDHLYKRIEEKANSIERIAEYREFILENAQVKLRDVRRDVGRIAGLYSVVAEPATIEVDDVAYILRGDGKTLDAKPRRLGGSLLKETESQVAA